MAGKDVKKGRPDKFTVDYFPHYIAENKAVTVLEQHFKLQDKNRTKGYAVYYKLLELVGNTKLHRVKFGNKHDQYYVLGKVDLEEDEFLEVIQILVDIGEVDRELWENEKVIWVDDFVKALKPVYYKRGKNIPTKDGSITDISKSISVTGKEQEVTKGSKVTKESNKLTQVRRKRSFQNNDYSTDTDQNDDMQPIGNLYKELISAIPDEN